MTRQQIIKASEAKPYEGEQSDAVHKRVAKSPREGRQSRPGVPRQIIRTWLLLVCIFPVPVSLVLFASALDARACNETTMLDFIGSLEAPGGFDTVYYGARIAPPRPITTMSVGEVLDWQRRTVRGGSVSSAAGRYQIVRPTLKRLVDTGVVSRGETFDAATQQRLGLHLLRETGYRAGDTSTATANRIAGVWAALPRIGGAGAGRSVYEGIAGNHALVKSATYQGVLECRIAPEFTVAEASAIRAGRRFGFEWDRFIEDLSDASKQAARGLAPAAMSLLFALLAADLVMRAGKWALSGSGSGMFAALTWRLLAVLLCVFLIEGGGRIIAGIANLAARLTGSAAGSGQSFSLAGFAAGKMALVFSLFEGVGPYPQLIQVMIAIVAVIIVVLAGLQMGVVIYWYARLFLTAAAGIPVIGLGGLTQGMAAAQRWMISLFSSGMSLMALFLVLAVTELLAWDVRSTSNPAYASIVVLFLELLALALLFLLPRSAGSIVKGT